MADARTFEDQRLQIRPSRVNGSRVAGWSTPDDDDIPYGFVAHSALRDFLRVTCNPTSAERLEEATYSRSGEPELRLVSPVRTLISITDRDGCSG